MKKWLKILLISICSCLVLGGAIFGIYTLINKKNNAKVVSTIFPIYDVCRELVGKENCTYLESTGVDMHSYQASAEDISIISKAEVFIYVGGESEAWVEEVLSSIDTTNTRVICLMDTITALEEEKPTSAEEEHEEEHEHEGEEDTEYDEHIWLSVKNMKLIVAELKNQLSQEYTDNSENINLKADNYISKLNEIDSNFTTSISSINNENRFILCADRFPFRYVVNDYNISYDAAFIGCSAETEASAGTIASLINNVNSHSLKYILRIDNENIANTIKNDNRTINRNNIEILVLSSCEKVNQNKAETTSFLNVLQDNYNKISKAIKNV